MDSIDEKIDNILFQIGQDIRIHKVDAVNMIIEIDYDKYAKMLKSIILEEISKQT